MLHALYSPRCPAMFDSIRKHRLFVFGFVLAWALSHRAIEGVAVAQNEERPVPGDRIRKKLDQIISFDYSGQSFRDAIAHVQDRTQMPITIDPIALQQVGVVDGAPMQIELKNVRNKVRQALQGFLQQPRTHLRRPRRQSPHHDGGERHRPADDAALPDRVQGRSCCEGPARRRPPGRRRISSSIRAWRRRRRRTCRSSSTTPTS